jgi:nitrite reductase (NO-forming)
MTHPYPRHSKEEALKHLILPLAIAVALTGCQPSEKETGASPSPAETIAAASPAATTPAATGGATTQAVSGEKVYTANCASCHQAMGQGLPGTFPPLAGAEIPNGDPARHINVVLNGLNGEVTVKGQKYNGAMPPWKQLSDDDLAAVITYERTSWGNSGGPVTADDIKKARK